MRSVFSRLLGIGRRSQSQRRELQIVPNENGFSVFDSGDELWSLRWDEVCRVVAFKLDRVMTDTICIGFQRENETDRVWTVEEEWEGYKVLHTQVEEFTNGSWYQKWREVANPAFEFNWTVIWERPNAPELEEDPLLIWRAPPKSPDPVT